MLPQLAMRKAVSLIMGSVTTCLSAVVRVVVVCNATIPNQNPCQRPLLDANPTIPTLYKYFGVPIAYHEDFIATLAIMTLAYKSHLLENPHFKPIVKELEALSKAQYTMWTTLCYQLWR